MILRPLRTIEIRLIQNVGKRRFDSMYQSKALQKSFTTPRNRYRELEKGRVEWFSEFEPKWVSGFGLRKQKRKTTRKTNIKKTAQHQKQTQEAAKTNRHSQTNTRSRPRKAHTPTQQKQKTLCSFAALLRDGGCLFFGEGEGKQQS